MTGALSKPDVGGGGYRPTPRERLMYIDVQYSVVTSADRNCPMAFVITQIALGAMLVTGLAPEPHASSIRAEGAGALNQVQFAQYDGPGSGSGRGRFGTEEYTGP